MEKILSLEKAKEKFTFLLLSPHLFVTVSLGEDTFVRESKKKQAFFCFLLTYSYPCALQARRYSVSAKKINAFILFCSQLFVSLQRKRYNIMEVTINNNIYQQASAYAKQQGLSINAVIENFLVRFIGHSQEANEQPIPDVVLSLLGAGEPADDNDLNAREAYQQYLEEKYK